MKHRNFFNIIMIIFYNSEEDISFMENDPCQSAMNPSDELMLNTHIQDKPKKSSKPTKMTKTKLDKSNSRQPTRIQPKRK